jgi:tetratricopeptide (TPR) repeat protein
MMRNALLLPILAVGLAASSAHANNVWDNALSQGKPERAAEELYETKLREGDEHSIMANTQSTSRKDVLNQIERAIAAYRAAAAARPQQGEPYYRIGRLLYSFYFECNDSFARVMQRSPFCDPLGRAFDKKRAEEVIAAWDAFEARSPLDPRLTVGPLGDTEILFDRAILRTKLATKTHLAGAAQDYEKILARLDSTDGTSERVRGNLAETYMMLGRMEEALETYRHALRNGSDTATWYGYAVALDRDENPRQALEIIRSLGPEQRELFYMNVNGPRASTFFVPEGEKYYYFALTDEAFGHEEEAIANWRKFLASGAHPEFHPRAKAHLEALSSKKKRKSLPIDSPWPGLLR